MILLFLSVWAIVIALNEVLFAAQPFSMTSIAAAMPHTLMFSVVLSAAVYIAKKRIIDAVHKGRPIDKRFVAELTPEVGHQLNSMRRKLEAMDGNSSPGKKVKGKQKGRNFPSDSELAKANKDIARRNKEKFDRLHENAQKQMKNEQARKHKDETKQQAHAKAVKQTHVDSSYDQEPEAAVENHNDRSGVVGDPNDFVKEAHAQMMEQAQSRIEAAQRKRKAHDLQIQRQNAPSMGENKARLAKEKELQKERREAQIKALGALSQEERAAEDARRAHEAQIRAQEQEKAAALARAEAIARAEAAARAQAQAQAQAKEMARARAEAEAREKIEAEQRAMAKVRELAAAKARASAAARAREQEMRYKIEQEAKLKAQQEEKARKAARARSEKKLQEEAQRRANQVEHVAKAKSQHQMEFEIAQPQEKKYNKVEIASKSKPKEAGGIEYVDQIEIPKGGLDTSSLKPYQMPKRGAGLDTSALKKAKLNQNSKVTLSNASLTMGGASNKNKVSASTQAKAMSAILNNDTNLERGDVQTLELSNYQANARARALSRAQANKASLQEQNIANVNRAQAKGAQVANKEQVANNVATRRSANAMHVAKNNLGAKGPIGIGTTVAGMPHNYVGSQNAPARKVVTTTNQVQARPQGDNLPKTAPSNPLANIQTAPVIKGRNNISAQNRENLFNGAQVDINPNTQSKTDLIHAQANANAYMKMQSQTASVNRKAKGHRTRPSEMLQSNEVV